MEKIPLTKISFKEKVRLGRLVKAKDRGENISKEDQILYDLYGEEAREDMSFQRKKYLPIAIFVTISALLSLLYHTFR
jgi:hypothetical protein